MKYATLSLTQERSDRHPMHRFLAETDGYGAARLLGSTLGDGIHTALFHVDGWPPDPYGERLCGVPSVQEYALSTQSDGTFSVYVREELDEHDRGITGAFRRAGLVIVLPVVYRPNGEITVTLVGPTTTLQTAIEAIPAEIAVDLRDIGGYDARRIENRRDLTARQAEAVTAAVECGYYEEPREGSVADVAEAIGCAPGTAAEHLRRAERTAMRTYAATTPS
ncbi:helix-turn-helix domain-containing protein [Natronomonas sp. F2-12]|jgi:predicted DNA binding protein|uniref:Helix-turn-helix domain-containing protein n=1 Tax=Natronomonas aquatica TaxID=2841590 RepID=A0A9R1CQQ1_9EURY|nr:helix-turn-helix domain-containing protein [Natronomonas aquatica]MCQ4332073.1 helix-turn-helix domain-containing protein [Natronomonas aquatica]